MRVSGIWSRVPEFSNGVVCRSIPARAFRRHAQIFGQLVAEVGNSDLLICEGMFEKALAETAALLVLQKKVKAIWGEPEDEKSNSGSDRK